MRNIPHLLLSLSAVVLLAFHVSLREGGRAGESSNSASSTLSPSPTTAEAPAASSAGEITPTEPAAVPPAPGATRAIPEPARLAFNWAEVETTDFTEYVRRLRAIGFPNELVREIILADVNKIYEAREQALTRKLVPYDAPMSARQSSDIRADDWQRVRDLWALRMEKQTVEMSILGEYVPREILRTMISRNYEAYEYALNQLPPEKREPVQRAQETEIFTEGYNKVTIADRAAELESFKRTRAERDEAIRKVLTPEEFERYEMNTLPAGTELARRVIGMQPSDEEFAAMYRIAWTNWVDTGGVYGRWRARYVPGEQIATADEAMDQGMKQALGPDRYIDYRMAISGTGQQLRNFAARFELPRERMVRAFDLQTQIEALSRRGLSASGDAAGPVDPGQLQLEFQQLLGPDLYAAWNAGRNLRVNLDP